VEALSDAEEVVRIVPTWAKGFSRKGAASLALDDCYNATLAYRAGLKIEPTNTSMLQVYNIRQHTSAYVSIRQHTSAYVSIRQHTSAHHLDAAGV
jgi:predicted TPR repeat methyltransferase